MGIAGYGKVAFIQFHRPKLIASQILQYQAVKSICAAL